MSKDIIYTAGYFVCLSTQNSIYHKHLFIRPQQVGLFNFVGTHVRINLFVIQVDKNNINVNHLTVINLRLKCL